MKVSASTELPAVGTFTAFDLSAEFTARSNSSKNHSSKARLEIVKQVLINEDKPSLSQDEYRYNETRLLNVSKLIAGADVFTYGLNILLPVDFYMNAVGIGAGIEADIKRTGISGKIGPRFTQSVILESSVTELLGPGGEAIGGTVDAGVGGELRLIQGGLDYGFAAGLNVANNRVAFINDMYASANLEFLRGRIYTFYTYPIFKCGNIFTQFLDLNCWEQRRVENDIFNSGAALKFNPRIVSEDKSAYVSWN